MTITAPIAILDRPDMSAVTRKFVVRSEVKKMTTATAVERCADTPAARLNSPRGLDLMIERFAVAVLDWSRARASRAMLSRREHARLLQQSNQELQREADALRLTQRLGL